MNSRLLKVTLKCVCINPQLIPIVGKSACRKYILLGMFFILFALAVTFSQKMLGNARHTAVLWLLDMMDVKQLPTTRAKSVKALGLVVEADPAVLNSIDVQKAVEKSLQVCQIQHDIFIDLLTSIQINGIMPAKCQQSFMNINFYVFLRHIFCNGLYPLVTHRTSPSVCVRPPLSCLVVISLGIKGWLCTSFQFLQRPLQVCQLPRQMPETTECCLLRLFFPLLHCRD